MILFKNWHPCHTTVRINKEIYAIMSVLPILSYDSFLNMAMLEEDG